MTNSSVPIFSLVDLKKGLEQDKLRTCLIEKGVFYLKDHGVLEAEHQLARDHVMNFFQNAGEEERASIGTEIPGVRRGYTKLEAESTAQVTNTGEYSDYSMCYSMGISDNLFPSPIFKQVWTAYFHQMYLAAQATAREVLNTIGVSYEENIDSFLDCDPVLRFRYFPEVPEHRCAESEPLRMAPHYDLSIITLIHQTSCPNGFVSLQCEIKDTFMSLPQIPDSLVVICGAVSTLVSGGKIKAPNHRVLAPTLAQRIGSSRTSSVFFLRPKPDFMFSIPLAKKCGFDISLAGETASFKDWIGGNYNIMIINESYRQKQKRYY